MREQLEIRLVDCINCATNWKIVVINRQFYVSCLSKPSFFSSFFCHRIVLPPVTFQSFVLTGSECI